VGVPRELSKTKRDSQAKSCSSSNLNKTRRAESDPANPLSKSRKSETHTRHCAGPYYSSPAPSYNRGPNQKIPYQLNTTPGKKNKNPRKRNGSQMLEREKTESGPLSPTESQHQGIPTQRSQAKIRTVPYFSEQCEVRKSRPSERRRKKKKTTSKRLKKDRRGFNRRKDISLHLGRTLIRGSRLNRTTSKNKGKATHKKSSELTEMKGNTDFSPPNQTARIRCGSLLKEHRALKKTRNHRQPINGRRRRKKRPPAEKKMTATKNQPAIGGEHSHSSQNKWLSGVQTTGRGLERAHTHPLKRAHIAY